MKLKRKATTKSALVIVSAALLIASAIGLTVAFIIDKTDPITNTFIPSVVSCQVIEVNWQDGDTVKEDVKVKNTGDTEAYIRCAIVINWQNDNGEVYATAPVKDTHYEISINDTDWTLGADGYYYYKYPVGYGESNSITNNLINSCTVKANAPDENYTLSVEILASAVQSEPASAVKNAWGEGITISTVDEMTVLTPVLPAEN